MSEFSRNSSREVSRQNGCSPLEYLVTASHAHPLATFRAFLARYAELLETGVYFYEAETYEQVIPQNLGALHTGAVRQDDFYRRLFPLAEPETAD